MERKRKAKPPRLQHVFQRYDAPLYFVSFNTQARRPLLASPTVHGAFVQYASRAPEYHMQSADT
ncbi:MAG: hypothetical protein H0W20_15980 [Chthoniobacterales bacterium]|nr:hypothetical protein [Chthoniobacterales bacterium]